MCVIESGAQELYVIPTFRLNKEVVNILIIGTAAYDKFGRGCGQNSINRSMVTIVEIKKDVKITVNKVLYLNHIGLTAPGELFLAKVIRRELLQAIERHIFLINISNKMHYLSSLLELCENPKDGFV